MRKKEQMKCRKKKIAQKDYLNQNRKCQLLITNVKGITLIALIITIIVMLILVGVTVSVAINGGLFANAKQAKTNTQNAINAENELSDGRVNIEGSIYNSIDEYIEEASQDRIVAGTNKGNWTLSKDGNTVTDGSVTLNIGDYVNYTYETTNEYSLSTTISGYDSFQAISQTTGLKWRVLGVDANACLTLISSEPTSEISLKKAMGYNNGVYILNDICAKQYSNNSLGINARSITLEDIEGGFNSLGVAERDNYTSDGSIQYGKHKGSDGLKYPVIYGQENGSGIDTTSRKDIKNDGITGSVPYYNEKQLTSKPEGEEFNTATTSLVCTQTFYSFDLTSTNYYKNNNFHNMVCETDMEYWLATRYVNLKFDNAHFGLFNVYSGEFDGDYYLFNSNGNDGENWSYLRPVVSLGSNIKVEKCEGDANGIDTNHMHSLSNVKK